MARLHVQTKETLVECAKDAGGIPGKTLNDDLCIYVYSMVCVQVFYELFYYNYCVFFYHHSHCFLLFDEICPTTSMMLKNLPRFQGEIRVCVVVSQKLSSIIKHHQADVAGRIKKRSLAVFSPTETSTVRFFK